MENAVLFLNLKHHPQERQVYKFHCIGLGGRVYIGTIYFVSGPTGRMGILSTPEAISHMFVIFWSY